MNQRGTENLRKDRQPLSDGQKEIGEPQRKQMKLNPTSSLVSFKGKGGTRILGFE